MKHLSICLLIFFVLLSAGCKKSNNVEQSLDVTTATQILPASCTSSTVNSTVLERDPTDQSAQSFNVSCTQNNCGRISPAGPSDSICDSKTRICSQEKCTNCSSGTTPCPFMGFSSTVNTQFYEQYNSDSCKSNKEQCLPWTCKNFSTDSDNCGSCGKKCITNQTCYGGKCLTKCGSSEKNCSGTCTNVSSSTTNCGSCGKKCADSEICNVGNCECPQNQNFCSGKCAYTDTSAICGSCIISCGEDQHCVNGHCQVNCPAKTYCGGECTDTTTSHRNCGHCGKTCGNNQSCKNSVCKDNCNSGETQCSGNCADITTDAQNCGKCGHSCTSPETCISGTCSSAAIAQDTPCDAPGAYGAGFTHWFYSCDVCSTGYWKESIPVCAHTICVAPGTTGATKSDPSKGTWSTSGNPSGVTNKSTCAEFGKWLNIK